MFKGRLPVLIPTVLALGEPNFEYSEECLSKSWVVLSILIGGLAMARAVAPVKTADQIAISKSKIITAAGQTKERQ
jgi:hypothetical protein